MSDWGINEEHAQAQGVIELGYIVPPDTKEWLVSVEIGKKNGQPIITEHIIKARSSSDREAQMDALGIDRENGKWAAGYIDDKGRTVDVGNDPIMRAKLRLELPQVFQRY